MTLDSPVPTEPTVLIHVGYHKTATTWMQRRLFTPALGYHQMMDHAAIFAHFVRPHPFAYDAAAVAAAVKLALAAVPSGLTPVMSSEILCGNPFFGGRETVEVARRLRAAVPNARILITIREQIGAIASTYMQYLQRAGEVSHQAFFSEDPVVGYTGFAHEHFHYDRFVAMYAGLFGAGNVLVNNQELLIQDHIGFARRIADFVGQVDPVNASALDADRTGVSYPEHGAGLLRRINHFRTGPCGLSAMPDLGQTGDLIYRLAGRCLRINGVSKLMGARRPITDYVRQRYAGVFAAGNRTLRDMVGPGLPLDQYQGIN